MAPQIPFDFNPIIIDDVESDSYRCRYSITSPGIINPVANLFLSIGISGLAFTKTYLQLTDYYAFSSRRQVDIPIGQSTIPESFTPSLDFSNPLVPTKIHGSVDHGYTPQNILGIYEFSRSKSQEPGIPVTVPGHGESGTHYSPGARLVPTGVWNGEGLANDDGI